MATVEIFIAKVWGKVRLMEEGAKSIRAGNRTSTDITGRKNLPTNTRRIKRMCLFIVMQINKDFRFSTGLEFTIESTKSVVLEDPHDGFHIPRIDLIRNRLF